MDKEGWKEGPFIKGHPIYLDLYTLAKDLFEPFVGVSRVYESYDTYGGFWITYGKAANTKVDAIRAMDAATAIRKLMNAHVGFSIIAKPQFYEANSDSNPYTSDAVCLCLVPKRIADRNEKCDGDAMIGALAACVDAGIEIRSI
jgi:hypothetical protein